MKTTRFEMKRMAGKKTEDQPSSTCFRWQFLPPMHFLEREENSDFVNKTPPISLHSLQHSLDKGYMGFGERF